MAILDNAVDVSNRHQWELTESPLQGPSSKYATRHDFVLPFT